MSVLTGASMPDVRTAASAYLVNDVSILPLNGKKAAGRWQQYQEWRMNWLEFTRINWHRCNVGIVCGAVSGNLLVVDLDGREAVLKYISRWPELLQTLTVRTGRGYHLYYTVDHLPDNRRIGGIELRGNGCYVVAPPSVHPETKQPYTLHKRLHPAHVDLAPVAAWLDGMRDSETPLKPKERPIIRGSSEGVIRDRNGNPVRNPKAYARFALNDECSRIGRQLEGGRNEHLNRSALRLGQLARLGWLTEGEIESALLGASARWSDMSERERLGSIRSGLEAAGGLPNFREG